MSSLLIDLQLLRRQLRSYHAANVKLYYTTKAQSSLFSSTVENTAVHCFLTGRRHRARASGPCPFLPSCGSKPQRSRAMGDHSTGRVGGWDTSPGKLTVGIARHGVPDLPRPPPWALPLPAARRGSFGRPGPRPPWRPGLCESRRGRSNRLSGRPACCVCVCVGPWTSPARPRHSDSEPVLLGCLGKGNLAEANKGDAEGLSHRCAVRLNVLVLPRWSRGWTME